MAPFRLFTIRTKAMEKPTAPSGARCVPHDPQSEISALRHKLAALEEAYTSHLFAQEDTQKQVAAALDALRSEVAALNAQVAAVRAKLPRAETPEETKARIAECRDLIRQAAEVSRARGVLP